MSARPEQSQESGPTWTTEPVYDASGQRICGMPDCTRRHSGRGLCRMHFGRWKSHGDPYRRSRFTSEEEKAAFIATQIESRRELREQTRKQREVEKERQRLLRGRSVNKIRPEATALVHALDEMSEAERAAVASLVASVLLGQPVEDVLRRDAG